MSSGNQVLLGQYGATNRTYSSSSLILPSVCASRLTGGNAYLCRPCTVPVHPCQALPRIGSRTTGNGRFLEMQTGLPEQLRNDSKSAGPPGDGVSTPKEVLFELVGCLIEHSWDVDGMNGDLRCFWVLYSLRIQQANQKRGS